MSNGITLEDKALALMALLSALREASRHEALGAPQYMVGSSEDVCSDGTYPGCALTKAEGGCDSAEFHRVMKTNELINAPIYSGTKQMRAIPMTRGAYVDFRGFGKPNSGSADDDGYMVEYLNGEGGNVEGVAGYVSWSPKAVFDETYSTLPERASCEICGAPTYTFSEAIAAMEKGERVTRPAYYGMDRFIYEMDGSTRVASGGRNEPHFPRGQVTKYNSCWAIFDGDDSVSTWLPCRDDIKASDWIILDDFTS